MQQLHLPCSVLATPSCGSAVWLFPPGLGRKSVACIMLLTLGKKEFPVDTNVGRICAR